MITSDQMIYSVSDLKKAGLSYYKINQLVDAGKLIKLNRKAYENTEYTGEYSDFIYVSAFAEKGVICMLSAAVYYGLSNYIPDAVDIAIPRTSKISTIPDWPAVNIWYFNEDRYGSGIEELCVGKDHFKIYDIEKTVVDLIYYREKIGIEETKEVLVNYLNFEKRNLNKLIRYSKIMKCEGILRTYLEVLV